MRKLGILLPLCALLLVGCGNDSSDDADDADTTDSPSVSESVSPSATPTPSATPSTSPTSAGEPADGRDLGACRDRTCEVEVKAGDTIRFAPRFITDTLTIERISKDRVEYSATDDQPSPLRGWLGGTGTIQTGDIRVDFDRVGARVIIKIRPRG